MSKGKVDILNHLNDRCNEMFTMGLFDKLKLNNNVKVLEKEFPFYDDPNTATITCSHIIEDGKPILYLSHDKDDGMWQF